MTIASWFHLGDLPQDAFDKACGQPFLFSQANVWSSITFRGLVAPGRRAAWKRQWFFGSLAITEDWLLAYRGKRPLIRIQYSDPKFDSLIVSAPDPLHLKIQSDLSLFHSTWSGQCDILLGIASSPKVVQCIFELREMANSNS